MAEEGDDAHGEVAADESTGNKNETEYCDDDERTVDDSHGNRNDVEHSTPAGAAGDSTAMTDAAAPAEAALAAGAPAAAALEDADTDERTEFAKVSYINN